MTHPKKDPPQFVHATLDPKASQARFDALVLQQHEVISQRIGARNERNPFGMRTCACGAYKTTECQCGGAQFRPVSWDPPVVKYDPESFEVRFGGITLVPLDEPRPIKVTMEVHNPRADIEAADKIVRHTDRVVMVSNPPVPSSNAIPIPQGVDFVGFLEPDDGPLSKLVEQMRKDVEAFADRTLRDAMLQFPDPASPEEMEREAARRGLWLAQYMTPLDPAMKRSHTVDTLETERKMAREFAFAPERAPAHRCAYVGTAWHEGDIFAGLLDIAKVHSDIGAPPPDLHPDLWRCTAPTRRTEVAAVRLDWTHDPTALSKYLKGRVVNGLFILDEWGTNSVDHSEFYKGTDRPQNLLRHSEEMGANWKLVAGVDLGYGTDDGCITAMRRRHPDGTMEVLGVDRIPFAPRRADERRTVDPFGQFDLGTVSARPAEPLTYAMVLEAVETLKKNAVPERTCIDCGEGFYALNDVAGRAHSCNACDPPTVLLYVRFAALYEAALKYETIARWSLEQRRQAWAWLDTMEPGFSGPPLPDGEPPHCVAGRKEAAKQILNDWYMKPIVRDDAGQVVSGHMRLRALELLEDPERMEKNIEAMQKQARNGVVHDSPADPMLVVAYHRADAERWAKQQGLFERAWLWVHPVDGPAKPLLGYRISRIAFVNMNADVEKHLSNVDKVLRAALVESVYERVQRTLRKDFTVIVDLI